MAETTPPLRYKDLIHAVVPDPQAPWTSTTLDKIEEVVDIIVGATLRAEVLVAKCRQSAGPETGPCDPLPIPAGMMVTTLLSETLSSAEIKQAADLLLQSERI
jgi:hypothetical protein